jgi:hypothetical protein
MKYSTMAAGVMLLYMAAFSQATNWKSPDGKLGFDLPSDGSLIEVKNPPAPAVAMWETADHNARLLFLTQPNPKNIPLEQAGLEEGTISQLPGGKILSSNRTTLGDVPTYTIAATGSQKIYLHQIVLAFDGTVYKVMAAGATPISDDPHLAGVFKSVTVLDPAPDIPGKTFSSHELSKKAGAIGVIVLVIAALARRNQRGRQPNVNK